MIEIEESSGIRIVRLAHGKASALDLELLEALSDAADAIASAPARAAVLTGSGSIFSAGVDLFRILDGGAAYVAKFYPALCIAFAKLFALDKPLVAAVNGHAIAGGCVLAAACDYRIMAAGNGRIGVPELLVGVPFPAQVIEILRFSIPQPVLGQLILRGVTITPDEALAKGVVDQVAPQEALLERAVAIAAQMAAVPPDSFALTKRLLRRDAIERGAALGAEMDPKGIEVWSRPEIHRGIREYLDRTVGKPKSS